MKLRLPSATYLRHLLLLRGSWKWNGWVRDYTAKLEEFGWPVRYDDEPPYFGTCHPIDEDEDREEDDENDAANARQRFIDMNRRLLGKTIQMDEAGNLALPLMYHEERDFFSINAVRCDGPYYKVETPCAMISGNTVREWFLSDYNEKKVRRAEPAPIGRINAMKAARPKTKSRK